MPSLTTANTSNARWVAWLFCFIITISGSPLKISIYQVISIYEVMTDAGGGVLAEGLPEAWLGGEAVEAIMLINGRIFH